RKKMNLDSLELKDFDIDSLNMMGDYLLIKPREIKKTEGFLIPKNSSDKPTMGFVLGIGNGIVGDKKTDMVVKLGDLVIFNEWAPKPMDGVTGIFYIKQSDIIAYIRGGSK
ncbi:MAG: hypothetical protein ACK5XN_20205, partial [Bacteroidota bacterium]